MTPDVTLITPTRDRPEAFELCRHWMARQDFRGEVQWIIVDDGDTPAFHGMPPAYIRLHSGALWHVDYLRRPPSALPCTLVENLLAAIPMVRGGKILIIEDDDWYAPHYIEIMAGLLGANAVVGETYAHYYHVGERRYGIMPNTRHACLARTGLQAGALWALARAAEEAQAAGDFWVDLRLWRQVGVDVGPVQLVPWRGLGVGIKGLPGRGGLGAGHVQGFLQNADTDLRVLRSWVGDDVALYARYGEPILVGGTDGAREGKSTQSEKA